MRKILSIIILLLLTKFNATFGQGDYEIFKKDGKTGVKFNKQEIIPAEYDSIHVFIYGKYTFFKTFLKNKCGIINSENKTLYPLIYDDIWLFNNQIERTENSNIFHFQVKSNNSPLFELTTTFDTEYNINGIESDSAIGNLLRSDFAYNYCYMRNTISNKSNSIGNNEGQLLIDSIYRIDPIYLFGQKYYYVVFFNIPGISIFDTNLNKHYTINSNEGRVPLLFLKDFSFNQSDQAPNFFPIINTGNRMDYTYQDDPIEEYYNYDGEGNVTATFPAKKYVVNFSNGKTSWLDSNFYKTQKNLQYFDVVKISFFTSKIDKYTRSRISQSKTYLSLTAINYYFDPEVTNLYSGDPIIVGNYFKLKEDSILKFGLVDFYKKQILPSQYLQIEPLLINNEFVYKCLGEDSLYYYFDVKRNHIKTLSYNTVDFLNNGNYIFSINFNKSKPKPYLCSYTKFDFNYSEYISLPCNNKIYTSGTIQLNQINNSTTKDLSFQEISIPIWNNKNEIYSYWNPKDTVDFCTNNQVDTSALIFTKNNNGWGAIDLNLKEIIPNQFSKIERVKSSDYDLYIAKSNTDNLVYDKTGKVVFNETFDRIVPVYLDKINGFAIVNKDKLTFYSSFEKDNIIIPLSKDLLKYKAETVYIYNPYNGNYYSNNEYLGVMVNGINEYADFGKNYGHDYYSENQRVYHNAQIVHNVNQNNRFISFKNDPSSSLGVIDKNGKLIVPFRYQTIIFSDQFDVYNNSNNFKNDGFIVVSEYSDRNFGLYDKNGNKVLDEIYQNIISFSDSLLKLTVSDTTYYLLNPFTKNISPLILANGITYDRWNLYNDYDDNYILASTFLVKDAKSGKEAVLNNKAQTIIPPVYDNIVTCDRIHYIAEKNEKFTLFNANGKALLKEGEYEYKFINMGYHLQPPKGYVFAQGKKQCLLFNKEDKIIYKADSIQKIYFFKEDSMFRIEKNKTTLLIDSTGKLILKVAADEVSPFYGKYASFFNNDKQGVIDKKGKTIIPARFSALEIENNGVNKLSLFNGCFKFIKNNKYGLVDTNNVTKVDAIYDNIFTNKSPFALVTKNDKHGVINSNGDIIAPFTHDIVYLADAKNYYQCAIYKIKNKDTSYIYGLLDSNFTQVLEHRYKLIGSYEPTCNCYPLIDTNNNMSFYLLADKKIVSESNEFKSSYYGRFFYSDLNINYSPTWNKQNNLFGCDATAFYIDENSNYWLGTGSSGGVYFSDNKGNSWKAINDGIGPCHISLIGKVNGQLYIEKDYEFIYQLNTNNKWTIVLDHSTAKMVQDKLKTVANDNYEKIKMNHILQWKCFKDIYINYINEFSYDLLDSKYSYFEISNRNEFYNDENSYQSHFTDTLFKNHTFWVMNKFDFNDKFSKLPDDILLLRGGNIFKENEQTDIILAQSGVYRKDKNKIERINETGIEATDIRQFLKINDNSIYALAAANSILWYNGKEWKKVFDYYNTNLIKPDTCSESPEGIHQLNYNDGKICFSMHGHILGIDKNNNCKIIKSPTKLYSPYDTSTIVFESLIKVKGIEYGIAVKTGQREGISRVVYRIDKGKIKSIYKGQFIQLYRDNKENIWCFQYNEGYGKIFKIENDSTFTYEKEISRLSYNSIPNSFIVCDNQTLSVLGYNKIHEFNYQSGEWQYIEFELPYTKRIYDYDSLGKEQTIQTSAACASLTKNAQGDYYIGTGFYFSYGCGGWDEYIPDGVFKLCYDNTKHYLKKIENEPNKWILSLLPYKDGLMVGTSGSGIYYINTKK